MTQPLHGITETVLIEVLGSLVDQPIAEAEALLAKGDSDKGLVHEHRYAAAQLLSKLLAQLLEWYKDCEEPFLGGEIGPALSAEAKAVLDSPDNAASGSAVSADALKGLIAKGVFNASASMPAAISVPPTATFTSILFTTTVAKVLMLCSKANFDAQETLIGYKLAEHVMIIGEHLQLTGRGMGHQQLTTVLSSARRHYVTAGGRPPIVFCSSDHYLQFGEGATKGSTVTGDPKNDGIVLGSSTVSLASLSVGPYSPHLRQGTAAAPVSISLNQYRKRASFAGTATLLESYVHMCMCWSRWDNPENTAALLNAAYRLTSELRVRREKLRRTQKATHIDRLQEEAKQAHSEVDKKRDEELSAQEDALQKKIAARKEAAAAKKKLLEQQAGSPAGVESDSSPLSSTIPSPPPSLASPSSATPQTEEERQRQAVELALAARRAKKQQQQPSTPRGAEGSPNGVSLQATNAQPTASAAVAPQPQSSLPIHKTIFVVGNAISSVQWAWDPAEAPYIVPCAIVVADQQVKPTFSSPTAASPRLHYDTLLLMSYLHEAGLDSDAAVQRLEGLLLTSTAQVNKSASNLTAAAFCHRSLSFQVEKHLLKSSRDIGDWIIATLNLAEFYLSKCDLSHAEHCLLAVEEILEASKVQVAGEGHCEKQFVLPPRTLEAAGLGPYLSRPSPSEPSTSRQIRPHIATDLWPNFDVAQYHYLWASFYHQLMLLGQNAFDLVVTESKNGAFAAEGAADGVANVGVNSEDNQLQHIVNSLGKAVVWVASNGYLNPALLPEEMRNAPTNTRENFLKDNCSFLLTNSSKHSSDAISTPTGALVELGKAKPTVTTAPLLSLEEVLMSDEAFGSSDRVAESSSAGWCYPDRMPIPIHQLPHPRASFTFAFPRKCFQTTAPSPSKASTKANVPLHNLSSRLGLAANRNLREVIDHISDSASKHLLLTEALQSLAWPDQCQQRLLYHLLAAKELSTVDADFEKFLHFRRMEADSYSVCYSFSELPVVSVSATAATLNNTVSNTNTTSAAASSSVSAALSLLPTHKDDTILEMRISVLQSILDTNLNPKSYRNVVRQADYDCGNSSLQIAVNTNSILETARLGGVVVVVGGGGNSGSYGQQHKQVSASSVPSLEARKAEYLDQALSYFKSFLNGFYQEMSAAQRAGKKVSAALEESDYPTIIVGEMRVAEVLMKKGLTDEVESRLEKYVLQFIKDNPLVLKKYPEVAASKAQCEDLLSAIREVKAGKPTKK